MSPKVLYALDEADEALTFVPMAARRALDGAGLKLSLDAWRTLPIDRRHAVARAGAGAEVDAAEVAKLVAGATPGPQRIAPVLDPPAESPPDDVVHALGPGRSLDASTWRGLAPLDRYVLAKLASRGKEEKLVRAYEEIVRRPSHLDARGEARMVGVAEKPITDRRAVATARVRLQKATLAKIAEGGMAKGDVFGAARIAGILAAKRTPELIPLCHGIALTKVDVGFEIAEEEVVVRAAAQAIDRTGAEMEAMVAASVAALTIYDMVKSIDPWATIAETRLEEKSGGKSGHVVRGGR